MDKPTEFSLFISTMAEKYAPVLGLSIRGFRQYLVACQYQDRLYSLSAQRTDCALVLSFCQPVMHRLCPEQPERGWLAFIYDTLSAGLFPIPGGPEPTTRQTLAMDFYLDTLEYFLALEPTQCPPDPLLDIPWVGEDILAESASQKEYQAFRSRIEKDHVYSLLRMGRYCMPFDPAAHTIGVCSLAVHCAMLARSVGLEVDVALVCGAALSHDLGKFGCRGADSRRVPAVHYYYTWQYLSRHGLSHIAHVAANHSTWDLEFENLPIESLLLIYADFRVRGQRDSSGAEHTGIFPLEQSYSMILSKLSDMTPEKTRRYATVYAKLRDFESYLRSLGIIPELTTTAPQRVTALAPALTQADETLTALRNLTFDRGLRLMATLSSEDAFQRLLEQARGERNLQSIRTYLLLLEAYHTYMPERSKHLTLGFLYELLTHREGDVRRRAATIMGRILANSGPSYRKTLPADAPSNLYAPTLMGYIAQSRQLWQEYIALCLHPDRRFSPKHAERITSSLKIIATSLFSSCGKTEQQVFAENLPELLSQAHPDQRETLIQVLTCVPADALEPEAVRGILDTIAPWLSGGNVPLRLILLRYMEMLLTHYPPLAGSLAAMVLPMADPGSFAVAYARHTLLLRCGVQTSPPRARHGELFLSDLKQAVHWTVKLVHIDYLENAALTHPDTAFHTATHLSNLLSVSEHLSVREYAGKALLRLLELLTLEQQNELVVDLTRELETGQEQISYYVAPVLGRLLSRMPDKELLEGLDYLKDLIHTANGSTLRAATAALYTLGALLASPGFVHRREFLRRCLGLVVTGIAHYDPTIHRTALTVLCRDIFLNPSLPLENRRDCLLLTGKKLLCMLSEPTHQTLTFYHHAAMLNHMYRLLVACEVNGLSMTFPELKPVAFFPGTFDPFSAGHKEIVRRVRDLGYEVYLAIDEFSWSKRTAPKLLRRKISAISVADLWDVYLYPDDSPVNIAKAEGLTRLCARFPEQRVTLVVGSDVIVNASAYRREEEGCVRDYDHVVFSRASQPVEALTLSHILRRSWQLLTLPQWCDGVSSSLIRQSMDQNLDISSLVDPVVQSLLYDHGLYVHAPVEKSQPEMAEPEFVYVCPTTPAIPPAMAARLRHEANAVALCLRGRDGPLGWVCGHGISERELLFALGSAEAAACVRAHTAGRLFLVDMVICLDEDTPDIRRRLVGELLARCLQGEYTWALCRCATEDRLLSSLSELGFLPLPGQPDLQLVDLRAPVVLLQDLAVRIKAPLGTDPEVIKTLTRTRQDLRRCLTALNPGSLLLTFDTPVLSQCLSRRIQAQNPPDLDGLGSHMCVPYGDVLQDQIVPNTVTKALHCDRVYDKGLRRLSITHAPGYGTLRSQVRTLGAFCRPVILVDDLLHQGHRIAALEHLFREEGVEIQRILVGILSGQGRDLLLTQGRQADCEYEIPNLRHWLTESSLYPFLGGDSVAGAADNDWFRPAVNSVLPYGYPPFLRDHDQALRLSSTALMGALEILRTLERQHLTRFSTVLTLRRLSGVLRRPRLPDRGRSLLYDPHTPPSQVVADDLAVLGRIHGKEEHFVL